MQPTEDILVLKKINKAFPGVKALTDMDFSLQVEEGEIHALVGENGAGKSTLMNVLSGIYPYGSYEGDIIYDGEVCKFDKIKDSEEKGIVIIHQELALIPYMTIGENMFLGNERGHKYKINWNETNARAAELLKTVGLKEGPQTLIKDIGVGKQQLVEIAKALAKNAKLLILDEPTASLNETDSKALLDLMLELKKKGMTSIIISHKLNEISYVADKITVIRDGSTIETLVKGKDDITESRIIKGMVGREIADRFPKREPKIGEVLMEVKNWTVHHPLYSDRKVVDNVNLNVKKGEVVGISGAMIFLYNSPGKNIFMNIGLGLWDSYNMATGLLGDVLSYVRLFALGLSGGILAGVFNSLAVGMSPDNVIAGPIVMVLIFVIGHAINIFMNVLGAMVHPMRLTFVEFFKNSGYEGGGKEYKPFRNLE